MTADGKFVVLQPNEYVDWSLPMGCVRAGDTYQPLHVPLQTRREFNRSVAATGPAVRNSRVCQ